MNATEQQYLKNYHINNYDVPLTTVDMSIFSIIDQQLHVLLIKRDIYPEKNKQALPGGFIDLNHDIDLEQTAHRKLFEKTGIKAPYLEQVESIGNQQRDPRGWSLTILYFALIDREKIDQQLSPQTDWFPIKTALKMDLAFDHHQLLIKAVQRLKSKTCYTALPIALLPKQFTLTELQTIFEIILERKLPVKSFRRRVQTAEVVKATEEQKIVGKRPARLYQSTGLDKDFYFPRPLQL